MATTSSTKDIGRQLPPPPYLSPPEEATLSNFSKDANPSPAHKAWQHTLPPIQTVLSPPASPSASPRTKLPQINPDRSQASAAHDPPLFSHSQSDDSAAPLFDDNSPDLTARIDSLSPEKQNVKPKKIFARYLHGFDSETPALDYWRMNLNEASQIPGFGTKKQVAMHPPVINTRLDAYTASLKHSLDHPSKAGVTKSRPTPPKAKAPKPAKVALPPTPRKASRIPVTIQRESKSQSVEPQARKRAPPTKSAPLKEEDKDWAVLPDYTPPTSTLDNGAKPLKVTWKGSPNDLRNDPAAQFMHPQEIEAAAELKLFGAQYMANKRRIFEAKLKSLKEGKNFTKTAAQQACNIDVNKTSKMWEAFDKSGWFDREHFEKWL